MKDRWEMEGYYVTNPSSYEKCPWGGWFDPRGNFYCVAINGGHYCVATDAFNDVAPDNYELIAEQHHWIKLYLRTLTDEKWRLSKPEFKLTKKQLNTMWNWANGCSDETEKADRIRALKLIM